MPCNSLCTPPRRALPGFTLNAGELAPVVRICQLVEGMPLAIELAAAWTPTLSCAEISREIQHDIGFLTTSLQDVPERHRSLRAVFDHTWTLLTPDEQHALSRLAVLRGRFDRPSASEVAGASLSTLASLAAKSLLHRDGCGSARMAQVSSAGGEIPATKAAGKEAGTCYTLHELVRQYAAVRLGELPGEPVATQDRHCTYFLDFLGQRKPALEGAGQREALAAIADQIDNVRAAWDWALTHGRGATLGDALLAIFLFCYMRSRYKEGEAAFGRLVVALQGGGARVRHRHWAWRWHARVGSLFCWAIRPEPRRCCGKAWSSCGRSTRRKPQLSTLPTGARWRCTGATAREARRACQESLELYRAAGDRYGMAVALNILGRAAYQRAEYDEAQRQCQESLELARALGNRWSLAFSLEHLGQIALAQLDYRRAGPLFTESLAIRRDMGDQRGIGLALDHLGRRQPDARRPHPGGTELSRGAGHLPITGLPVGRRAISGRPGQVCIRITISVTTTKPPLLPRGTGRGRGLGERHGRTNALTNREDFTPILTLMARAHLGTADEFTTDPQQART